MCKKQLLFVAVAMSLMLSLKAEVAESLLTENVSMENQRKYLFTSESVTEGHPDKMCDRISDSVLDKCLEQDKNSRVACETFATGNLIIVGGEITTKALINVEDVVRNTVKEIGYDKHNEYNICYDTCEVLVKISQQSPDIARGVDVNGGHKKSGAGDQGLMFGYACDETEEYMPLPIKFAHDLTQKLAMVRRDKTLPWAGPDGKAQVTVEYVNNKPTKVTSVVIAVQHDPDVSSEKVKEDIKKHVILPVCQSYVTNDTNYYVNETGAFVLGGPVADAGLTGRKIIVDTYGGMGRHGGGCFSGKDPSKVDRSAAYMARYVAKNIVAADIAKRCEVQLAYAIGVAEPVSVSVNCFGTALVNENDLEKAIRKVFPLEPAEIIKHLDLQNPIYAKTSAYGHFGRKDKDFTWEKTDKVDELRKALNMDNVAVSNKDIQVEKTV